MNRRNTRHGFHGTRFYHLWKGIRTRTTNPNCDSWSAYGGKGITNDWIKFEQFHRDMYRSYLAHCRKYGEKDTTIERLNNSKGYSKSNCVWATWKEQSQNKTYKSGFKPRYLTYRNKTQSVTQWAKELKIKQTTLDTRINELKWSVEKALSTPININQRRTPVHR